MTEDDSRICDRIAVYQHSFIHQSALSPKKTHVKELKEKWIALTKNGNMQQKK
jgi:hypothetical protein